MSGEEYQPADEYEPDFTKAVLPSDVAPYLCDHETDTAVCKCVHDWRIHWGNKAKVQDTRATYLTG